MSTSRSVFAAGLLAFAILAGQALGQGKPQPPASGPAVPAPLAPAPGNSKPAPMVMSKSIAHVLAEKIAAELVAASPVVDPGDVKARDLASEKMLLCENLINAAGGKAGGTGRILWGGFNPNQGYDPEAYRIDALAHDDYFQLTEFTPAVWAKLYLSTFMFPGPYTIHKQGKHTVLEMDVKFRDGLPPGDYPYPFWHSPNKWTAYVKVQKVLFIFDHANLKAAMRQSPDPVSIEQIRRPWDTKWLWTDEQGNPQPRVALFGYMFSKENPHIAPLEKTYRKLEASFRAQNCMVCHEPDNRARINDLLLLNYPNQALIARNTLVTVLEGNHMPPGSAAASQPEGIQDKAALAEMTALARAFEKEADAAFAYEKAKPPVPPSAKPGGAAAPAKSSAANRP